MTAPKVPATDHLANLMRLPMVMRLAAIMFIAVIPAATAAAQATDGTGGERAQLVIEAQDSWVQPGDRFAARVAFSDAPADASLDVRLHPAVTGRIEFAATLLGDQLKTPLVTLAPISIRAARARVAVIPGRPVDDGNDRAPGVYPVSITLRSSDDESLAQIVTHLIQLGPENADFPPLAVGVLFDLGATAVEGGTIALSVEDHATALSTVAAVAVDHPSIPVALRLDPRRIADERAPAELISAMSTARLIPETFVLSNPADWVASGLEIKLDEQRASAERVMVDQLGRVADADVIVMSTRPDRVSRDWHRARGAVGIVTSEEALEPLDPEEFPVTLARPFALSDGDDLAVLTVDPLLRSAFAATRRDAASAVVAADDAADQPAELARRLDTTISAISAAHRILAELAVIWSEQPSRQRGVILAPPTNQIPDQLVLEALFEQLDRASTVIEPMDLGRLFTEVPRAETTTEQPLVRSIAPTRIEALDELAGGLEQSDALLLSYGGFVGEDAPRLQPLRRQQLDAGDSELDAADRRRLFDTISATINADLGGVSLPDGQRITLTSRTAQVPLIIRKERSGPVTIKLSFSSQKLDFTDGPDRTIELVDEQTELSIPVEARASGEFPLEVIATSPDGQLEIANASLTVRSTAFSGVGLLLSGGALAFLVVWWARNALARRRDRPSAGDEPSTDTATDTVSDAATDTSATTNGYGGGGVSLPHEPRYEP